MHGAGLRKSGLKRAVIIAIVCIRFVIMPMIGIAVVHAAYGVGFLSHDPLYRYVLMVQFALPPAMNIGKLAVLKAPGTKSASDSNNKANHLRALFQEPWLSCSMLHRRSAP
jgi:predicted permease